MSKNNLKMQMLEINTILIRFLVYLGNKKNFVLLLKFNQNQNYNLIIFVI